MPHDHPQLILASESQTRKTLLLNAGVPFTAVAAAIDETTLKNQWGGLSAVDLARDLAKAKAKSLIERFPAALIIGADQTLQCGGELYSKPTSLKEAKLHLRSLSGKTHHLHSAIAIVRNGTVIAEISDRAELTMRTLSETFINDYVVRNFTRIRHSVGCYQIEHEGMQLFASINGDYNTILGLPLIPLLTILRREGMLAE